MYPQFPVLLHFFWFQPAVFNTLALGHVFHSAQWTMFTVRVEIAGFKQSKLQSFTNEGGGYYVRKYSSKTQLGILHGLWKLLLFLQEQLSWRVSELLRQKIHVKFFIVIFPVFPEVFVIHIKMKNNPEVLGIPLQESLEGIHISRPINK